MTTKTNTDMIAILAAALPLHDGETILWYRAADHGFEMRVRDADGFEGMHDVYVGQLSAAALAAMPTDDLKAHRETLHGIAIDSCDRAKADAAQTRKSLIDAIIDDRKTNAGL